MKNTLVTIALRMLATALVAAAAAPAYAQSEEVIATVPFDFSVGSSHLPAGKYFVHPVSDDPSVMVIQSADGRQSAVTLTIPASGPDAASAVPELTFETRGTQHILARVVDEQGNSRAVVPPSRRAEVPAAPVATGGPQG